MRRLESSPRRHPSQQRAERRRPAAGQTAVPASEQSQQPSLDGPWPERPSSTGAPSTAPQRQSLQPVPPSLRRRSASASQPRWYAAQGVFANAGPGEVLPSRRDAVSRERPQNERRHEPRHRDALDSQHDHRDLRTVRRIEGAVLGRLRCVSRAWTPRPCPEFSQVQARACGQTCEHLASGTRSVRDREENLHVLLPVREQDRMR